MPQVLVNGYITRDMSHCQLFTQLSYVAWNHKIVVISYFFEESMIPCHLGQLCEKLGGNHISMHKVRKSSSQRHMAPSHV